MLHEGKEAFSKGTVARGAKVNMASQSALLPRRVDRIAFVLSTGRTGTKALAHHFDQAEAGVVALHEPRPSRRLNIVSNMYRAGRCSRQRMVAMLARSRRHLMRRLDGKLYLESNPWMWGCVDALEEVFGEVWVVHVVRHPGAYVRSAINFGVFDGLKGLFDEYIPYWKLKPIPGDATRGRSWREMTAVERLAWRWTVRNQILERAAESFGGRYLRLRYEDLFDQRARGIEHLAEWLGIPGSVQLTRERRERRINASVSGRVPPYEDWNDELKERVERYCGEMARAYGYTL